MEVSRSRSHERAHMLQLPRAKAVTSMFQRAQLRKDAVPKTAENFRALCTGEGNALMLTFSCPAAKVLDIIAACHASNIQAAVAHDFVIRNSGGPLATAVQQMLI